MFTAFDLTPSNILNMDMPIKKTKPIKVKK